MHSATVYALYIAMVVKDLHMILYRLNLGCDIASAVAPTALGGSLRICHDLRGLLALGKGDRWSCCPP